MRYWILLFVTVLFFACNSNNSEGNAPASANPTAVSNENLESPDIDIEVRGVSPGNAMLVGFFCETQYYVDTAVVDAAGKMNFKRDQPYDPGLYLAVMPNQSTIQLMITEDQRFSMSTEANNFVNTMVVKGSLDNELLYENLKFEASMQPRMQSVAQSIKQAGPQSPEYSNLKTQQDQLVNERKQHLENIFAKGPNSLFAKFKKAGQNPEIKEFRNPDGTMDAARQVFNYKSEFWNDVDFNDKRLLYTPVIFNKLKRYMNELTPQNPDSLIKTADDLIQRVPPKSQYYKFFTNWIAATFEPGKVPIMDAEAIYVHMVQNYFTEEKAFWLVPAQAQGLQLRASEMANSLLGQKGPNVKVPDQTGRERELYDIKAPYIIVFMYNPDCDHCQEETPILRKFYQDWKNQGVEVYAIAIDTEPALWQKFIQDYQIGDWINVFDPTNRSIYKTYYVDNTPELYVLNKDRVIIGKNLKPYQVPDIIRLDQQNQ